MAKDSKVVYGASGKTNVLTFEPENLHLVTDKTHPLYDERMTITSQAVNELIQSLENAGELSIKERKYLELARAYQQLAAENAFILQLMHEQAGCFNAALIEGFHNLVIPR